MTELVKFLAGLVMACAWLAGIVIAKGFWSTAFAVFIPPYALYLVVEHFMRAMQWI